MDIHRQLQTLAWCNPIWYLPSSSKETNELLQQCLNESDPEPSPEVEEVIMKSKEFPIPFPIESIRLQKLRERRPVECLKKNIASTYLIVHERVLLLIMHFLVYKREFGSTIEKNLYKKMSVTEFVDRVLKKRAITFMNKNDQYKLITGEEDTEGWESVGTLQQKPPLVLENVLSYDEMKISSMIYVSGHTAFINNGNRQNRGIINEDDIEKYGVIIGLIGPRLKRTGCMEQQDMLLDSKQNCSEHGYGEHVAPATCLNVLRTSYVRNVHNGRQMYRQMWSEFYQIQNYTYEELTSNVEIRTNATKQELYTDRYVQLPNREEIFDNEVYYKRLSVAFDSALLDANNRAEVISKMAFCNIVGIGLGVWRISDHQRDVFVLSVLERVNQLLKKDLLQSVATVNMAFIKPSETVAALFSKNMNTSVKSIFLEYDKHPKGGIKVKLENREPSAKLSGEHEGELLVTTYPWDGNAHPGNEFWIGSLAGSGDPAAACSTQISELHNAHINTALRASNLMVVGQYGLLPLQMLFKSS